MIAQIRGAIVAHHAIHRIAARPRKSRLVDRGIVRRTTVDRLGLLYGHSSEAMMGASFVMSVVLTFPPTHAASELGMFGGIES